MSAETMLAPPRDTALPAAWPDIPACRDDGELAGGIYQPHTLRAYTTRDYQFPARAPLPTCLRLLRAFPAPTCPTAHTAATARPDAINVGEMTRNTMGVLERYGGVSRSKYSVHCDLWRWLCS